MSSTSIVLASSIFRVHKEGLFYKFGDEPEKGIPLIQAELTRAKVLEPGAVLRSYVDSAYQRGGAETYICRMSITTDRAALRLFVKTIIEPGRGADMVQRRRLLEAHKVPTTRLVGFLPGKEEGSVCDLFEEDVNPEAEMTLDASNPQVLPYLSPSALEELGKTAAVLDHLGFAAVNFVRDMLVSSDKSRIYYADFGSDLGGPGAFSRKDSFFTLERYFRNRPEVHSIVTKAYHKRMTELQPAAEEVERSS